MEPANASKVIEVLVRSAMRPRLGADVIPVSTTESPSGSSPSSGMSIDTDEPANVREVSGVGSGARFSPASFATTVNVTFALAVCSKSSPIVYTAVWTPGSSGAWNRTSSSSSSTNASPCRPLVSASSGITWIAVESGW